LREPAAERVGRWLGVRGGGWAGWAGGWACGPATGA